MYSQKRDFSEMCMKSAWYSDFKKKNENLISDSTSEHIQIKDKDVDNTKKFSVTFKKSVYSKYLQSYWFFFQYWLN